MEEINNYHPTIKFTAEWSRESVSFLDVKVILRGGRIITDLYTKPTDTHQYLHQRSCHPGHCKSSIAYSQALRIRRICSDFSDYLHHTKELEEHLVTRGHNRVVVQEQINRATTTNRGDALRPSIKQTTERVPFVVTYHPQLPRIHQILTRHLPTLHISDTMRNAVALPPLVANRRPKNLKDLLVRATLKPPLQVYEGSSQCLRPRCKTCPIINTNDTFTSNSTGNTFRVRATATCKTKNIIYLIECRLCGMQYVGETENALHIRMNGHRSDINRNLPEKPVAAHFNAPGHSADDLSVMVIERVLRGDAAHRKARESFWIYTLRSLTPHGLNLDP